MIPLPFPAAPLAPGGPKYPIFGQEARQIATTTDYFSPPPRHRPGGWGKFQGTAAPAPHSQTCQPWRVELFIQIHADNQIESDNERDSRLEDQIRQRLARFEGRITDVEVHVSDVNGNKGGNADLRCTIEARVNGIPPVA